ncbi:MAG: CHAT domain-containing protein [Cyanobacteria bacterium P01_D01_bin.156]
MRQKIPINLGLSLVFFLSLGAPTILAQTHPTQAVQIETLLDVGERLFIDDQLSAALDTFQQAKDLYRQDDNSIGLAITLQKIGQIYHEMSQPQLAVEAYQQALGITDMIEIPQVMTLRADIFYSWGRLAFKLGQREQAIALLNQVIELSLDAPVTPDSLGYSYYILGAISEDYGDFPNAIEHYTQAQSVFERGYAEYVDEIFIEDQIKSIINIGNIWTHLGDYETAKQFYKQALALDATGGDTLQTSQILDNLGVVENRQGNYSAALNFYQQALAIKVSLGRPSDISATLHNLGNVHIFLGELKSAISLLNKALELTSLYDRGLRINLKITLARAYSATEDYAVAWENYHQALRLALDGGERQRTIMATISFAESLVQQKQPLLAIAFYKQAINDIEQIRDNVRSLPLETQQRYVETVSNSYRELVALLLKQNRVFEAQQVLDLLKIQELEDYFHDVRSEQPDFKEKLPYLTGERILLEQHQILLLETFAETSPVLSLEEFLAYPDVEGALDTLNRNPELHSDSLKELQQKLNALPYESAVLYPLILEDRLELLLVSADGAPIHKTTSLSKHQIEEQVNVLRQQLVDPSSDVKAIASSLYDAIIAPFNKTLEKLAIEHIIYIPDGILHYIPLSVLYNRESGRWLTQDYVSYNLTASNVGDLTHSPQQPWSVLAGAFTNTNQTFEKRIAQQNMNFNGLPYAGREVHALQKTFPDTQILLDTDFTRANLENQLNGQNIVHLATHAAFVPGQPENSFILLGDGDTITLKELRHWSLPNVDLVVLSACQTGISHIEDGLEILGMGFQVQRTEAQAALASLWWVDDRATSTLMELFYRALQTGNTKAQALQSAQQQLIDQGHHEPYYWAPFVLIGNGS